MVRALAAWGIPPGPAVPLTGGAVNEHWRVEGPAGEPLVLRRYNRRHAARSIPYEHELLRFLAERQWPVAAPVATAAGDTVVETDAGRWALFPFLAGSPPPREPLYQLRKGAVLALLHEDMAQWDSPGQRPTFGRVTDLDVQVQADGFRSLTELIAWFAERDAGRADALAGFRARNLETLDRLGYAAQPDVVIYNECLASNVLFEDGDVTALLDFDLAHEDARGADVARSLLVDCWPRLRHIHSWMAGYAAHARPPLREGEAELLPPLMIANELWNTVVPLAISAHDQVDWMRVSVERSIDHRLPALEAAQDNLRQAIRAGAGFPD
jgi:Ser/Thr protein kinase RdoA (MazF antagonist)